MQNGDYVSECVRLIAWISFLMACDVYLHLVLLLEQLNAFKVLWWNVNGNSCLLHQATSQICGFSRHWVYCLFLFESNGFSGWNQQLPWCTGLSFFHNWIVGHSRFSIFKASLTVLFSCPFIIFGFELLASEFWILQNYVQLWTWFCSACPLPFLVMSWWQIYFWVQR